MSTRSFYYDVWSKSGTGAAVSITPTQRNRELFSRNREFWRRNREFHRPKPKSLSDKVFGTDRVLHAHPPDQCTEVRLDLRSPSPGARLPTPVTAKADPMPPHERLRLDDREDLQDRRKPAIQLDKEPAIVVCEPDPALHLTPQNDQLMSERRVLGFKTALRLKWP